MPKDQLVLLKKSLHNEIPAIVLTAKDICSLPALESYLNEARKHCNNEFIQDFEEVLFHFRKFKTEESKLMEIPNL